MPFCHECGAARKAEDTKCSACSAVLVPIGAPAQKPMTMMEKAAAAAEAARQQAARLADAMVTCRSCGAQPEAGSVNSKYCTNCGVMIPSAASAAASAAAGALSLAQKGMSMAADKLDAFAKGGDPGTPQPAAAQPPVNTLPVQPLPPPTPCPSCPECKGKGCSFCPAAAKQAALGQGK